MSEICRQLKDPQRNGGRNLELLHEHLASRSLNSDGMGTENIGTCLNSEPAARERPMSIGRGTLLRFLARARSLQPRDPNSSREIERFGNKRSTPVALPLPNAKVDGPAQRPAAGPVVPLTETRGAPEELIGSGRATPAAADATVTRV
jgi:hypothetical protein